MQSLNVAMPGLPVGPTTIVIWEGERQNPTPKLSPSGQNVGRWVMPDERVDYQGFASPPLYTLLWTKLTTCNVHCESRFGKFQPHNHTTPITIAILVLVKGTHQVRLAFYDQSWRCLLEVQLTGG